MSNGAEAAQPSLPSDVELEQALLGSILADNKTLARVSSLIGPQHFHDPLHGRTFKAMTSTAQRGRTITPLTLRSAMRGDAGLKELGGSNYFACLALAAPALPPVEDFAATIRQCAVRRNLVRIGNIIADRALTSEDELIADLIREAEDALREAAADDNGEPEPALMLGSAEFVGGFKAPNYLLDGILQRGFLYSLTGPTGSGKTAVGLRLLASVALGRKLAGREVEQGQCLMLVGENPDDVRMRWIALSERIGFDDSEIPVQFKPGIFSIAEALPRLKQGGEAAGGFSFVLVDTSPAYFEGDDENSNRQLGEHARMLRRLTELPGRPCVVATCHPVKNATPDNLLPRGGGAFLAEVDGNLTCPKSNGVIEVHWQGKFRGPDFEPLTFEMEEVTSSRLKNAKGRLMPTVIARPLSESEHKARAAADDRDVEVLLAIMAKHPRASVAALAELAGWKLKDGKPAKSRVSRRLDELKREKLAVKELNRWGLTPAGAKAAKRGEASGTI